MFELRLHGGKAPPWLFSRMTRLGKGILEAIYLEYGTEEILRRLSDPIWFQALSNVLGYDWDSSGSTTVTAAVVKDVLNSSDLDVRVAGGKGLRSRRIPSEIGELCRTHVFDKIDVDKLVYSSRMSAKVDTAAIQAGFQIYHHVMIFSNSGKWCVVQQGMNPSLKSARRYHWLSEKLSSFVEEPHTGIVGDKSLARVLDMTSVDSKESRKVSVEIADENPESLRRSLVSVRTMNQSRLVDWIEGYQPDPKRFMKVIYEGRVNWDALKAAYELKPSDYEQLLAIRGMGPATIRALSLVAEVIYDAKVSWKDPIKYSFALGGKDGIPYPVNRKVYDKTISFFENTIQRAKIGDKERVILLKRLKGLVRD